MSDIDEYDAYNTSLDPEILPYIIDLPPSHGPSPDVSFDGPILPDAPASPKSTYSDEFSKYDFSEFTTDELAALDATIAAQAHASVLSTSGQDESANEKPRASYSGGPAVEIAIEKPADESAERQTCSASSTAVHPPEVGPSTEATAFQWNILSTSLPYDKDSHFYRFRRRAGTLAVTDLSGPSWCEVQFEYGLLQKRSRKLEHRPASFATTTGKVIRVDQQAARTMDKIAKRGSSVHKALEREIHPEKVPVEITTNEERWALRILQMVESVQSLIEIGKCREMPIFGVLQGQVITGIIDEIQRRPYESPPSTPPSPASLGNDRKRDRPEVGMPTTPSKPKSKKARCDTFPVQPSITAFFSPRQSTSDDLQSDTPIPRPRPPPPPPQHLLHVLDTKSRNTPTMPVEEDTLPARLQLMFYHRLLSNALSDPATSTQALDFQALWAQLGLLPTLRFSKRFQAESGLGSDVKCLNDIVRVWRNAVEMLHVGGVDNTLTVIYRTQMRRQESVKGKEPAKGSVPAETSTAEETLSEQHQLLHDILANVAKRSTLPPQVRDRLFQLGVASLNGASTSGVQSSRAHSEPPNGTNQPVAGENVVPADLETIPEIIEAAAVPDEAAPPEPATAADSDSDDDSGLPDKSGIIGTKTFEVDNAFLDRYLASILQFWYGKRPPTGVDVHLTRRCSWCEYHDGCEWREMKAEEAMNNARARARETPNST